MHKAHKNLYKEKDEFVNNVKIDNNQELDNNVKIDNNQEFANNVKLRIRKL